MKFRRTLSIKPYGICLILAFVIWVISLQYSTRVYAVSQRATITFSIQNISISPGTQFSLPVNLSGAGGVTALRFSLQYNADILDPIDLDSTQAGNLLTDHTISLKKSSGKLSVLIYSSSLSKLNAGQGELIRLRFYVAEDAAPGTTAITFSELDVSTDQGISSTTNSLIGHVTISGNPVSPNLSESIFFPQVANGSYTGGKYVTTVILVNQGSRKVNARITFRKSSGELLPVTLTTQQSGSQISFIVPGNGSVFFANRWSRSPGGGICSCTGRLPIRRNFSIYSDCRR